MKKYTTLGDLLKDYRELNTVSQSDLSAALNVDIRTLIRWENNETLIKSDKEEELLEETFIPYQVIRNLNANVAIPTFYDFRIRKYSYSNMSNQLPEASWFKTRIDIETHRIRAIETDSDVEHITRYINFFYAPLTCLRKELILEAARLLPQLNLILFDTSGYYAGHSVVFPIKKEIYDKIRSREMSEKELDSGCLTSIKMDEEMFLYSYNMTADCNENIFYILCPVLHYFQKNEGLEYKYAGYALRSDAYSLLDQLGLAVVWEDIKTKFSHGLETIPRFYEGDFNSFLSG